MSPEESRGSTQKARFSRLFRKEDGKSEQSRPYELTESLGLGDAAITAEALYNLLSSLSAVGKLTLELARASDQLAHHILEYAEVLNGRPTNGNKASIGHVYRECLFPAASFWDSWGKGQKDFATNVNEQSRNLFQLYDKAFPALIPSATGGEDVQQRLHPSDLPSGFPRAERSKGGMQNTSPRRPLRHLHLSRQPVGTLCPVGAAFPFPQTLFPNQMSKSEHGLTPQFSQGQHSVHQDQLSLSPIDLRDLEMNVVSNAVIALVRQGYEYMNEFLHKVHGWNGVAGCLQLGSLITNSSSNPSLSSMNALRPSASVHRGKSRRRLSNSLPLRTHRRSNWDSAPEALVAAEEMAVRRRNILAVSKRHATLTRMMGAQNHQFAPADKMGFSESDGDSAMGSADHPPHVSDDSKFTPTIAMVMKVPERTTSLQSLGARSSALEKGNTGHDQSTDVPNRHTIYSLNTSDITEEKVEGEGGPGMMDCQPKVVNERKASGKKFKYSTIHKAYVRSLNFKKGGTAGIKVEASEGA